MAQDEIGATKLLDFQNEVIAEVGLNDREKLRREAWKMGPRKRREPSPSRKLTSPLLN